MLLLIDQRSSTANVPKSKQTTLVLNSGEIEVGPLVAVSVTLYLQNDINLYLIGVHTGSYPIKVPDIIKFYPISSEIKLQR